LLYWRDLRPDARITQTSAQGGREGESSAAAQAKPTTHRSTIDGLYPGQELVDAFLFMSKGRWCIHAFARGMPRRQTVLSAKPRSASIARASSPPRMRRTQVNDSEEKSAASTSRVEAQRRFSPVAGGSFKRDAHAHAFTIAASSAAASLSRSPSRSPASPRRSAPRSPSHRQSNKHFGASALKAIGASKAAVDAAAAGAPAGRHGTPPLCGGDGVDGGGGLAMAAFTRAQLITGSGTPGAGVVSYEIGPRLEVARLAKHRSKEPIMMALGRVKRLRLDIPLSWFQRVGGVSMDDLVSMVRRQIPSYSSDSHVDTAGASRGSGAQDGEGAGSQHFHHHNRKAKKSHVLHVVLNGRPLPPQYSFRLSDGERESTGAQDAVAKLTGGTKKHFDRAGDAIAHGDAAADSTDSGSAKKKSSDGKKRSTNKKSSGSGKKRHNADEKDLGGGSKKRHAEAVLYDTTDAREPNAVLHVLPNLITHTPPWYTLSVLEHEHEAPAIPHHQKRKWKTEASLHLSAARTATVDSNNSAQVIDALTGAIGLGGDDSDTVDGGSGGGSGDGSARARAPSVSALHEMIGEYDVRPSNASALMQRVACSPKFAAGLAREKRRLAAQQKSGIAGLNEKIAISTVNGLRSVQRVVDDATDTMGDIGANFGDNFASRAKSSAVGKLSSTIARQISMRAINRFAASGSRGKRRFVTVS